MHANTQIFIYKLYPCTTVNYIQVAYPGVSVVENLPANAGPQVQYLGQEDLLVKEMATDSSIIAWTEEPGRLESTGSQKSWT